MDKLRYVAFRATPDQAGKLERLAALAGGNLSEGLRLLVDGLEFEEHTVLRPVARFTSRNGRTNANSDVNTRQGSHAAVAA